MKVLIATHQWFPDYTGGTARVATETARRLADRGHSVHVVAPENGTGPSEGQEGSLLLSRVLPRGRVPQTISDTAQSWRYCRRVDSRSIDIVIAHHPTLAGGMLAARLDAPLVFVYHSSVIRELRLFHGALGGGSLRRQATSLVEPALELLERVTVARAARTLVLSEYSRTLVTGDHPARSEAVRRVSGGVDTDDFAPSTDRATTRSQLGVSNERPLIVVARRLGPSLGLESVLEAFARVHASPAPTLTVVGDGPLRRPLEALAERLGVAASVRFIGFPPPERLRAWYQAADLFVMSPAPHEGFGLATLEALASGTPVVGGPRGATPEILRPLDQRLVAHGSDAEALAAAMSEVLALADADLRRRCRDYAVDHYDWNVAGSAWEQALTEALACGSLSRKR